MIDREGGNYDGGGFSRRVKFKVDVDVVQSIDHTARLGRWRDGMEGFVRPSVRPLLSYHCH